MAGLVPAIHVLAAKKKDVDTRDKRGHDELTGRIFSRVLAEK
jgi:glycyl-tRNA synthetase beta chain